MEVIFLLNEYNTLKIDWLNRFLFCLEEYAPEGFRNSDENDDWYKMK